jgi:isoleucyl-tRNA synthetase
MDNYELSKSVQSLIDFVEPLTNWYLKLNRGRLKGHMGKQEWASSLYTLYVVFDKYIRTLAPFAPFMAEYLSQSIRSIESKYILCTANSQFSSVLLQRFPINEINKDSDAQVVLKTMRELRRVCSITRNMRNGSRYHSKVVIPLKTVTVYHNDPEYLYHMEKNILMIKEEINCLEFKFKQLANNVSAVVIPNRKTIGQQFRKNANSVINQLTSYDQNFLLKVYNGTNRINILGVDLTDNHYQLHRVPQTEINTDVLKSDIDGELMVTVDVTYDDDLHYRFQIKRIYSAVQNLRKINGIHPWDKISVMIDVSYGDTEIAYSLSTALKGTHVYVTDNFDDISENTITGIVDFEWLNTDDSVNKKGKLGIVVHKKE